MVVSFAMFDVVANDVQASVDFYRLLGIDIPEAAIWRPDGRAHHVEADIGKGTRLGINSRELTVRYDPDSHPARNYVIFSVPSREAVDESYATLTAAGYHGHLAPIDAFWGARYAVVDDPDGNHVGLMSPIDREHGAPPGF